MSVPRACAIFDICHSYVELHLHLNQFHFHFQVYFKALDNTEGCNYIFLNFLLIIDSSTVTMVTGHAGAPPPHLGVPRRLRQDQRDLAALAAQVPSPLASC